MTGLSDVMAGLIEKSAAATEPGDFQRDGLWHCGKCGTARQCRIELEGVELVVWCDCRCREEAHLAEQKALRNQERAMKIANLRVQGIQDKAMRSFTFDRSWDKPFLRGNIRKCREYVEHWPENLRQNLGLLMVGKPGRGKTYAAACIANALIDRGVPALMTSFPMILNSGWDKAEIVRQMKRFPLLVLDDLGIERESGYAMETVYFVIDERYKSRMPLIITTNLTLEELRRPKDIRFKRIYSRILEMCVPVHFEEQRMREEKAADKMRFAREVFG